MSRYVAFLRGMNLGRRRITNDELGAHFRALGFERVATFLASGNVVFDAPGGAPGGVVDLVERIESGLADALAYSVQTFLRTAGEVRAIAGCEPFGANATAAGGKVQVALLGEEPEEAAGRKVLEMATAEDRLAPRGSELYWIPSLGISGSELDMAAIGRILGPFTVRTQRTILRLATKFLEP